MLGGVGTIGRVVVRDLFESHPRNRILVADFNAAAARASAQSFRSRRVRGAFADARRLNLRGHDVVINCTQHDFNLHVMRAALRAGVHYVDLGGLFTWTRKQLKLHRQFQRAGLTAVLGMGCAPGITNVMSRYAVEKLGGRARSLKIRVGCRDLNRWPTGFFFPYSAQTIVEELTLPAYVFDRGKFRQVKPQSGWERVAFPKPVGKVWALWTRHSEVATLPGTLGVKYCDFKVSLDRPFVREVLKRLQAGWTVKDLARLPVPKRVPHDYEVARVIVRAAGRARKGAPTSLIVDCHARANRRWPAGAGDVDTGCPPSIVAQMIADGRITMRGAVPPEVAVPVPEFFRELRKRGMRIEETRL